jgi:ABC-type Fe3+-hydroxamate transport system substrate-binding protein
MPRRFGGLSARRSRRPARESLREATVFVGPARLWIDHPVIRRFTDDMNRELTLPRAPRRVVSLVPSDTLTVAELGCSGALVGRTDYCELPGDVALRVAAVGGTKNPRLDEILALEPDLVLANQEENTRGDLESLARAGLGIYVAFPKSVAEGMAHMAKLARIFEVEASPSVRDLCKRGYDMVREAESARLSNRAVPTFCPIWMNPLMTIHGTTFISDLLAMAGAENVFAGRERRYPLAADLGTAVPWGVERIGDRDTRYPRVTMEEVNRRAPELILLPDEPHPFSDADRDRFLREPTPAAARGAIVRMDGKDISWYGARSLEGLPRTRELVRRWVSA